MGSTTLNSSHLFWLPGESQVSNTDSHGDLNEGSLRASIDFKCQGSLGFGTTTGSGSQARVGARLQGRKAAWTSESGWRRDEI